MAEQLLAFNATVPSTTSSGILPIVVPVAATPVTLAVMSLSIPPTSPATNRVELRVSVGIAGTSSVAQSVFRLYRDGIQIFLTRQGIQTAQEQYYLVSFSTADFNVPPGDHIYSLTAERTTVGATASIAGPISLSGAAYGPIE